MRKFIFLLVLVMLAGCSGDETPDFVTRNNTPKPKKKATAARTQQPAPAARKATQQGLMLEVVPESAGRDTVLEARARGFSLDEGQVTWMLNGSPVATPRVKYFDSPELDIRKGDTVQAKALIDGTEVLSNVVPVVNARPRIESLNFVVPSAVGGDLRFGVNVNATDSDGDPVTIEYQWEKNGQPAGTGQYLDADLRRGDVFTITVKPFDGEEYGDAATLQRTVDNFPPQIVPQYDYTFEAGVYKCTVKAQDLDGDVLTYSLKTAPEGMSINPMSGEVTWRAPDDFLGTATFVVVVTDGKGGEAQLELSIIVEEEAPPAPKK